MKFFTRSFTALALATCSTVSFANTLAITNATVYTATEKGVLKNATVVIDQGKIVAVNPESVTADTVIDAKGKNLTPGFIGTMNTLGLVEVSAVARSGDASDKKATITFDPSLAFNAMSSVIPYTRKGGITSDIVIPMGGEDIFKGQSFVANLSGEFNSVLQKKNAVFVALGAKSKGSRAMDLQSLIKQLSDRQKALAKAENSKNKKDKASKAKEPSESEAIIDQLLSGKKPLIVDVDRASDILHVIELKKRFNLQVILSSASDAVVVAKQLADAKIPVIISATQDLPGSFDSLHSSLANAGKLAKAGVKVMLTINDTHNLYQLRFNAGIAIANGLDRNSALLAISANVADAFQLNTGKIAKGKTADLVLWSGDPFELSTHVEKMWIAGEEMSTKSRQDELRHRYTTPSDRPKAYTK